MKTKVLVTAGNTRVPIDRVRGIDNIFKGRTGATIAKYFALKGCDVTLLTSHPELVEPVVNHNIVRYTSYDNLLELMEIHIRKMTAADVVIHSAAVADYLVDGIYTRTGNNLEADECLQPTLVKLDNSGKISSEHHELWMKMVPTVKIIDRIRHPWEFFGKLVKFKLQVDMGDEELINVARRSMEHSKADFIVANTLEGLDDKAFIIRNQGGDPIRVTRDNLPATLHTEIFA